MFVCMCDIASQLWYCLFIKFLVLWKIMKMLYSGNQRPLIIFFMLKTSSLMWLTSVQSGIVFEVFLNEALCQSFIQLQNKPLSQKQLLGVKAEPHKSASDQKKLIYLWWEKQEYFIATFSSGCLPLDACGLTDFSQGRRCVLCIFAA